MKLAIPRKAERLPGFLQRLRQELPSKSISIVLEGLRARKVLKYGIDKRYLVVSGDMSTIELFHAGCRLRQALRAAMVCRLIRALEFWTGESDVLFPQ